MIIPILLFITGVLILIAGAHYLVNGASSLALRLAVPEIVIGLTVVAFGTSTPELIVSIFSSLGGYHEIVFGNIIGSNIFNILIILGISGLIYPLRVQRNTIWKEIPFSLLAVLVLFVLVNDYSIFKSSANLLSRVDGIILVVIFAIFLSYVFFIPRVKSADSFTVETYTTSKTIILISFGLLALFLGGKLVVNNAVLIAQQFGVSEKLIALTIVAGGTSLPELATSTVAALRKHCDIAVGNVIGSNIFNIYFILGVSSLIRDAYYDPVLNVDLSVLLICTLVLFLTMFTGKTRRLDRWEAVLFILAYTGYLHYLFFRK